MYRPCLTRATSTPNPVLLHNNICSSIHWLMFVIVLRTVVWMIVGHYYAPGDEGTTLSEMMEYIRGLPMEEQPEVFGMHDNALVWPIFALSSSII